MGLRNLARKQFSGTKGYKYDSGTGGYTDHEGRSLGETATPPRGNTKPTGPAEGLAHTSSGNVTAGDVGGVLLGVAGIAVNPLLGGATIGVALGARRNRLNQNKAQTPSPLRPTTGRPSKIVFGPGAGKQKEP